MSRLHFVKHVLRPHSHHRVRRHHPPGSFAAPRSGTTKTVTGLRGDDLRYQEQLHPLEPGPGNSTGPRNPKERPPSQRDPRRACGYTGTRYSDDESGRNGEPGLPDLGLIVLIIWVGCQIDVIGADEV